MSLYLGDYALSSFSNRKDRASKAFSAIDSQRALLSACTTQWQELEQYFFDIEKALQVKFLELSEREKTFESKINEAKGALDKREEAVSSREQGSLPRVHEQKSSALAAILDDRKELQEERLRINAQEKADNSASAAAAADLNVLVAKPENSVDAGPAAKEVSHGPTSLFKATNQAKVASVVSVRPELKNLCEKMDGDGLRNFVVEHRKDVNTIRNELPTALQSGVDPCRLVLKAVEGYHTLELHPSHAAETEAAIRRACILLLECLAQVLAGPVLGRDYPTVPSNVKESVKIVAKRWRSRMDVDQDESPLDAHAFLQLLLTFGITSEFPEDDLCKFVTSIARRKQTPDLCRSLGLTGKMPGLVDKLAKGGKQREALAFAHAFGLMETLQPVAMLKSYLDDSCKEAQRLAEGGQVHSSMSRKPYEATGEYGAVLKELSALRAVINAVEEYNLGSQYPTQNLHKRVIQLEKEKLERKRAASTVKQQARAVKQQAQKFRPGGAGLGPGGFGIVTNNVVADGNVGNASSALGQAGSSNDVLNRGYYAPTDLGQYGGSALSSYGLASQIGFKGAPEATYGSAYGVGNSSLLSNSYQYPYTDIAGSSLFGSTSAHSGLSGAYSNYQFGSGSTPSSYPR